MTSGRRARKSARRRKADDDAGINRTEVLTIVDNHIEEFGIYICDLKLSYYDKETEITIIDHFEMCLIFNNNNRNIGISNYDWIVVRNLYVIDLVRN